MGRDSKVIQCVAGSSCERIHLRSYERGGGSNGRRNDRGNQGGSARPDHSESGRQRGSGYQGERGGAGRDGGGNPTAREGGRGTREPETAKLATFYVRDLDGKEFQCTNRVTANERWISLQGMIRAMGIGRFLLLVMDIDFNVDSYLAGCKEVYGSVDGDPHLDPPLPHEGYQTIAPTMAFKDKSLFEKVLKLKFGSYDVGGLSLKSFLWVGNSTGI